MKNRWSKDCSSIQVYSLREISGTLKPGVGFIGLGVGGEIEKRMFELIYCEGLACHNEFEFYSVGRGSF